MIEVITIRKLKGVDTVVITMTVSTGSVIVLQTALKLYSSINDGAKRLLKLLTKALEP